MKAGPREKGLYPGIDRFEASGLMVVDAEGSTEGLSSKGLPFFASVFWGVLTLSETFVDLEPKVNAGFGTLPNVKGPVLRLLAFAFSSALFFSR